MRIGGEFINFKETHLTGLRRAEAGEFRANPSGDCVRAARV